MKRAAKPSTTLAIGGITLAAVFVAIAIVSPGSLDWLLSPSDERSAVIKREMERQKGTDTGAQSDDPLKRVEKTTTPSPPTSSPEETEPAERENAGAYERIPAPGCISQDQVARIIGSSEEARKGRMIEIRVTPGGREIIVAYRKKTFLGIGSGENQIEGILRRGLKNSFPDHLIKSLKVRSAGTRSFRRGGENLKAEILEIETPQTGCQRRRTNE